MLADRGRCLTARPLAGGRAFGIVENSLSARVRFLRQCSNVVLDPSRMSSAVSLRLLNSLFLCMLLRARSIACKVHAQAHQLEQEDPAAAPPPPAQCLPAGNGYLRARLAGALSTS